MPSVVAELYQIWYKFQTSFFAVITCQLQVMKQLRIPAAAAIDISHH